jgi:hypothetical protein
MKATLEFNLPEDQHEYDITIKASAMYSALWEVHNMLRAYYKYKELPSGQLEIVEAIREDFFEILNELEININK